MGIWFDDDTSNMVGKYSVNKLLKELQNCSVEHLNEVVDELCLDQQREHAPIAGIMRQAFNDAREDGDLPLEILLQVFCKCFAVVFARGPNTDTCYPIKSSAWSYGGSSFNARASAEKGRVTLNGAGIPQRSVDDEMRNRPIYVNAPIVRRLLRKRPASEATVARVAQEVIKCFEKANPGRKLLRDDFIAEVCRKLPNCSKSRAERAWRNFAPPSWRGPGRPKRSS